MAIQKNIGLSMYHSQAEGLICLPFQEGLLAEEEDTERQSRDLSAAVQNMQDELQMMTSQRLQVLSAIVFYCAILNL